MQAGGYRHGQGDRGAGGAADRVADASQAHHRGDHLIGAVGGHLQELAGDGTVAGLPGESRRGAIRGGAVPGIDTGTTVVGVGAVTTVEDVAGGSGGLVGTIHGLGGAGVVDQGEPGLGIGGRHIHVNQRPARHGQLEVAAEPVGRSHTKPCGTQAGRGVEGDVVLDVSLEHERRAVGPVSHVQHWVSTLHQALGGGHDVGTVGAERHAVAGQGRAGPHQGGPTVQRDRRGRGCATGEGEVLVHRQRAVVGRVAGAGSIRNQIDRAIDRDDVDGVGSQTVVAGQHIHRAGEVCRGAHLIVHHRARHVVAVEAEGVQGSARLGTQGDSRAGQAQVVKPLGDGGHTQGRYTGVDKAACRCRQPDAGGVEAVQRAGVVHQGNARGGTAGKGTRGDGDQLGGTRRTHIQRRVAGKVARGDSLGNCVAGGAAGNRQVASVVERRRGVASYPQPAYSHRPCEGDIRGAQAGGIAGVEQQLSTVARCDVIHRVGRAGQGRVGANLGGNHGDSAQLDGPHTGGRVRADPKTRQHVQAVIGHVAGVSRYVAVECHGDHRTGHIGDPAGVGGAQSDHADRSTRGSTQTGHRLEILRHVGNRVGDIVRGCVG